MTGSDAVLNIGRDGIRLSISLQACEEDDHLWQQLSVHSHERQYIWIVVTGDCYNETVTKVICNHPYTLACYLIDWSLFVV